MPDRFWAKVRRGRGCWEWTAATTGGYGVLERTHKGEGYVRAHRYSWELHNGPIPSDKLVCHRCDNPKCVRPSHLYLGTHRDNVRDATIRFRVGRVKEKQVRDIRRLWNLGYSKRVLSDMFGISIGAAYCIAKGKSFGHVDTGPARKGWAKAGHRVTRATPGAATGHQRGKAVQRASVRPKVRKVNAR